jgi:hypothetical protein
MIFEQVTSHSKSKFFVIKKKNKFYVVKKPRKINKRELLSIKKQNSFKAYFLKKYEIMSAKIIYNEFKKKGEYLVEYFDGISGENILLHGNKNQIQILKEFIFDYFSNIKKKSKIRKRNKKIIKQKLELLKKNNNMKYIKNSKKYFLLIDKLLNKDLYLFKNENCHGDLTLSNIIINEKNKKIILIDFLNTYEENIIQDFAKIFQEYILHWTSRKFNKINIVRSNIVYNNIITPEFWKKIDKNLFNSIKLEIIMTILRIVPYTSKKDKVTIKWIENSLNKIINFNFK